MTKHTCVHDEALKNPLGIEDVKVECVPKMLDSPLILSGSSIEPKAEKIKVGAVKPKASIKRTSRLEKATHQLFDLEEAHEPEKPLNIDFGLYQMEDY